MKKCVNPTYLLLLLFGLLVQSCGSDPETVAADSKKQETIAVIQKSKLQLLEVSSKNKEVTELISGRVIPKKETKLFSEVQGLILSNSASMKPGTSFRKGQLLLSIDAEEFRLNLQSQKSAFLTTITAIMPDLKSDYPENYSAWLNYIEAIDLSKSLAELPSVKSSGEKFFVTSRGVFTAYYSLKAQENRLQKYTLIAPTVG